MSGQVTITRPERPIDVTIALPRSKSVANRALILASIAGDLSCVRNPGDGDDTRILLELLRDRPRTMHCGAGGTTFRFLLAWACVQMGEEHVITGEARLMERPHQVLIDALMHCGADIERTSEGYRVRGKKLRGGTITLDSPISSQFISALLLIAPCMEQGLDLRWIGQRFSEPYVRMTMKVLRHFGAGVEENGDAIRVRPSTLAPHPLEVPRDWSAAAFWFEIVAMASEAHVALPGLCIDGWQGDEGAARIWRFAVKTTSTPERVLLEHSIDPDELRIGYSLADTPDLFQPLAVTFAALGLPKSMGMLHSLVTKETDRLSAMSDALSLLGCRPVCTDFQFGCMPMPLNRNPPPFDPRGDHRMAMALAPLALVCDAITIRDPEVVNKSYPGFWSDLRKAGFGVTLV